MASTRPRYFVASILFIVGLLLPAATAAQQVDDGAAEPAEDHSAGEPTGGDAPEAQLDRDRRVAVVALGDGAASGSAMQTLMNLLDADGFEVVDEERLRRIIATSLVPKTPPEIAGQFVGLSTRIGQGIEKFFYKGNQAALDILTPVFNLGMAHPEVLARRPDFARQIYEAGLVMIRAYRNLDRGDDARRLARALVERFPGLDTRSNSVPPVVTKMLVEQREALEAAGSSLKVRMVLGEGCQALVNGTEIGEAAFATAKGIEYFVTMECGGGEAPLWRIEAPEEGGVEVPVATRHPLDYAMPNAGFRHRKHAEAYLQMVSFWGDVPRMLGVAEAESAEVPDSVILVHLDAAGRAGWSDRADKKTVSRMLDRVMNDYGGSRDGASLRAELDAPPAERTDWLGWSLVGGGAAFVGAGTYGLIAASARGQELRCSPDNPSGAAQSDCQGVTTLRFANAKEFDAAESEVDTVRILSGAGIAVGLGLAGWGIYRLTTEQQTVGESAPRTVHWDVGLSHQGASVAARFSF